MGFGLLAVACPAPTDEGGAENEGGEEGGAESAAAAAAAAAVVAAGVLSTWPCRHGGDEAAALLPLSPEDSPTLASTVGAVFTPKSLPFCIALLPSPSLPPPPPPPLAPPDVLPVDPFLLESSVPLPFISTSTPVPTPTPTLPPAPLSSTSDALVPPPVGVVPRPEAPGLHHLAWRSLNSAASTGVSGATSSTAPLPPPQCLTPPSLP